MTTASIPASPAEIKTRYFYTDPLAAAWMAKHFGMELNFNDFDGPIYVKSPEVPLSGNYHHIDGRRTRFYIHPDSQILLAPQVDDAVEFDRWYWERQREPKTKDYPYQSHYGKVIKYGRGDQYIGISSAGIGWDHTTSENAKFSLPFKIIQRNGMAFHWPESEAA